MVVHTKEDQERIVSFLNEKLGAAVTFKPFGSLTEKVESAHDIDVVRVGGNKYLHTETMPLRELGFYSVDYMSFPHDEDILIRRYRNREDRRLLDIWSTSLSKEELIKVGTMLLKLAELV